MPATANREKTQLIPFPGEKQAAFALRANNELRREYPDTEERTLKALEIWDASDNAKEAREKAEKKFPSDKWNHRPNMPLFAEHTYQWPDDHPLFPNGQKDHYNAQVIMAVAANSNGNIEELGQYPLIIDKHTQTKKEKEENPQPEPTVIGHGGNFKIGFAGKDNPVVAIFYDEYQKAKYADKFEDMPTRSVEIPPTQDLYDRHIRNIAALATEPPAIPLGVHYSESEDAPYARYSLAFPGATNVHQPRLKTGEDDSEPSHYEKETDMELTQEQVQKMIDDAIAKAQGNGNYQGDRVEPENDVEGEGQLMSRYVDDETGLDEDEIKQLMQRYMSHCKYADDEDEFEDDDIDDDAGMTVNDNENEAQYSALKAELRTANLKIQRIEQERRAERLKFADDARYSAVCQAARDGIYFEPGKGENGESIPGTRLFVEESRTLTDKQFQSQLDRLYKQHGINADTANYSDDTAFTVPGTTSQHAVPHEFVGDPAMYSAAKDAAIDYCSKNQIVDVKTFNEVHAKELEKRGLPTQ